MDPNAFPDRGQQPGNFGAWLNSRAGWTTLGALAVLAFLIATGHRAHLLGALPYLLLLACPLMHVFMHGGHGDHGGKTGDGHSRDHHGNDSLKE